MKSEDVAFGETYHHYQLAEGSGVAFKKNQDTQSTSFLIFCIVASGLLLIGILIYSKINKKK